jgi:hypothetical protein
VELRIDLLHVKRWQRRAARSAVGWLAAVLVPWVLAIPVPAAADAATWWLVTTGAGRSSSHPTGRTSASTGSWASWRTSPPSDR